MHLLRNDKAAIARIKVGATRGTGFLVGDTPPTVLTALHVLADTRGAVEATFSFAEQRYHPFADLRFGDPDDGALYEVRVKLDPERVVYSLPDDLALVTLDAVSALPLRTGATGDLTPSAPWMSFGFPDDAKDDGLVVDGAVTDVGRGQLYCKQGAAGTGLKVAGLSGGPCIVDGIVVGVIVENLGPSTDAQATNRGGTLFFRPLQAIRERHPERFTRWSKDYHGSLTRLLPAQFEVVIELLDLSEHALAPPSAPQPQRAKELIELLDPRRRDELSQLIQRVGGRTP